MQSLLPAGLGRVTTLPPHWGSVPQNHQFSPFPLAEPIPPAPFPFAGGSGTRSAPEPTGRQRLCAGRASRGPGMRYLGEFPMP